MRIGVIGLGYVGYPLAQALAEHWEVVGYDVNQQRLQMLQQQSENRVTLVSNASELSTCRMLIVAVPTDVDERRQPDLRPLRRVANTVSQYAAQDALVVLESTVYPGFTNRDFASWVASAGRPDLHYGYSPERIVPGRPNGGELHGAGRTLGNTVKIISANRPDDLDLMADVYGKVAGGLHRAQTVEVAEAAKVVENCQRDLNIALVNELALLFDRLGVDTLQVLEAAGTKWNFHHYRPGLVGGHCIGVDPYYLEHAAKAVGFHLNVVLAGRQINDRMGFYVARRALKMMAGHWSARPRVLLVGWAFKENCDDTRNTRCADILQELQEFGVDVEVLELPGVDTPCPYRADRTEVFDVLILAVPHKPMVVLCEDQAWIDRHVRSTGAILDVKGALRPEEARGERRYFGRRYWRL